MFNIKICVHALKRYKVYKKTTSFLVDPNMLCIGDAYVCADGWDRTTLVYKKITTNETTFTGRDVWGKKLTCLPGWLANRINYLNQQTYTAEPHYTHHARVTFLNAYLRWRVATWRRRKPSINKVGGSTTLEWLVAAMSRDVHGARRGLWERPLR
jgi:hypothetical protein